jgi:hypothetical protein
LSCIGGTCRSLPSGGDPCTATTACQAPFVCKAGSCAVRGEAGDSCMTTPDTCDGFAGAYCAVGKVCGSVTYAPAGSFCDNATVRCEKSGFCKLGATGTAGTCLKAAADGEACSNTIGPYCMPPASCVGGFCKVADPATCR